MSIRVFRAKAKSNLQSVNQTAAHTSKRIPRTKCISSRDPTKQTSDALLAGKATASNSSTHEHETSARGHVKRLSVTVSSAAPSNTLPFFHEAASDSRCRRALPVWFWAGGVARTADAGTLRRLCRPVVHDPKAPGCACRWSFPTSSCP